eukprot:1155212-Pelagomonas_calceolata.AAC.4
MRQHTGGCAKGRMRQHTGECTQSSMRNYTGGQLQLNDLIQMPFACICSLFKLQSRLWAKRLLQSKAFTSRPMPPHEIGCSPMLLTSSFSPAACTMPASDVAYLQHQIPILSSSKCGADNIESPDVVLNLACAAHSSPQQQAPCQQIKNEIPKLLLASPLQAQRQQIKIKILNCSWPHLRCKLLSPAASTTPANQNPNLEDAGGLTSGATYSPLQQAQRQQIKTHLIPPTCAPKGWRDQWGGCMRCCRKPAFSITPPALHITLPSSTSPANQNPPGWFIAPPALQKAGGSVVAAAWDAGGGGAAAGAAAGKKACVAAPERGVAAVAACGAGVLGALALSARSLPASWRACGVAPWLQPAWGSALWAQHCKSAPCQHHGVHVVLLHGCSLHGPAWEHENGGIATGIGCTAWHGCRYGLAASQHTCSCAPSLHQGWDACVCGCGRCERAGNGMGAGVS